MKRVAPIPPSLGTRFLALLVDVLLLATFLLMGEFLGRALVFPVEEGSLRTAQEILERLHYAALGGAGLLFAVVWHAARKLLGGTPGLSFAGALPQGRCAFIHSTASRISAWSAGSAPLKR